MDSSMRCKGNTFQTKRKKPVLLSARTNEAPIDSLLRLQRALSPLAWLLARAAHGQGRDDETMLDPSRRQESHLETKMAGAPRRLLAMNRKVDPLEVLQAWRGAQKLLDPVDTLRRHIAKHSKSVGGR
ncbi:hypothetical protein L1887_57560 [Cichorium endivia]|nr:hypothetical protein L1887_57560 [Cichorium endivia]